MNAVSEEEGYSFTILLILSDKNVCVECLSRYWFRRWNECEAERSVGDSEWMSERERLHHCLHVN